MADSSISKPSLTLDRDFIKREEPAAVAQKANQQVLDALNKLKGDYISKTLSLPQHWRAVSTVWLLDGEVCNGGFHQFFWNTRGKLNEATLQDLKYLGATQHHELFGRALTIHAGHDYENERKRSGDKWEGFTEAYKQKRFHELDNEYYKVKPKIDEVLGDFIKRQADLYNSGSEPPKSR